MLQGDFSLQVLRIGADGAGQRHSDCVSMKPKQVSEKGKIQSSHRAVLSTQYQNASLAGYLSPSLESKKEN